METSWFAKRPVSGVRPGDHGWLAYSGAEERDRVMGTFVSEGLRHGEKVVYVTDTPPDRLPGMGMRTSLDVCAYTDSQQLRVIPLGEACLDSRGAFEPERMLDTLSREVDRTFGQGYRAARLTVAGPVRSEPDARLRAPVRRRGIAQHDGDGDLPGGPAGLPARRAGRAARHP
jgi:hypothetical protein